MELGLTYVQNILKRFGTFIYTGNRVDDIIMMDIEIKELYTLRMLTDEEYIKAINCLKRESKH